MEALRTHLALKNPRFQCRDVSEKHSLVVKLKSKVGAPAKAPELKRLRALAGSAYRLLEPLYRQFNGLILHTHRRTSGLVVAPVAQLPELMADWKASMDYLEPNELYPFQRKGIPFATIDGSGNYFVAHGRNIYYADHDGGDDAVWGKSVEDFFARALGDPAKFLYDAGCYTRYFDGKTDRQYIPEEFLHD